MPGKDHTSTLTGLQKALKGARTVGGLDVIYTKLAVDLQNLNRNNADKVIDGCLNVLCESTESDAVMLGFFDAAGERFARDAQGPEVNLGAEVSEGASRLRPARIVAVVEPDAPRLHVGLGHRARDGETRRRGERPALDA